MVDDTLTNEASYATEESTTADIPTPFFRWDVPDGQEFVIREGMPIVMRLEKNGGGDPSRKTSLGLAYREVDAPLDTWEVVGVIEDIAPFLNLSESEQMSKENADRRRLRFDELEQSTLRLSETDEVGLLANGPDVIDGSRTGTRFSYPMTINER